VIETVVDTRLGLGQVRSGPNISINLRFTIVLFVMLLTLSRNAQYLPRIGAFPFQLERVGCISKFSFLLAFEKRLEMVHRTDQNIAPGVPE
jgi:hypothetical protein